MLRGFRIEAGEKSLFSLRAQGPLEENGRLTQRLPRVFDRRSRHEHVAPAVEPREGVPVLPLRPELAVMRKQRRGAATTSRESTTQFDQLGQQPRPIREALAMADLLRMTKIITG